MIFIGENHQNLSNSLLPFITKLENNSTNNNNNNNNYMNSSDSSSSSNNNNFNSSMNSNSFYHNSNFVHTGLAATFGTIVYSDEERIHRMQRLLAMKLSPEEVASRSGPGGSKLSYLEGYKAINIANEVFGMNGWTTCVKRESTDYVDTNVDKGTFNVGCSATVVVTIQGGISREDTGYGKMENAKTKGDALEKCKKEAVTDGIKRALRQFGNLLGNCLYDKAYLKSLENMTKKPKKLNFATIYRPGQNVPAAVDVEDPLAPVFAAPAPPTTTDSKVNPSNVGASRPNSKLPQQASMNRPQVSPKSVELVAEEMPVDVPEEEEVPISSGEWCEGGMEGEDSGFMEASFLQASEQKPISKPVPRAPQPPVQPKPAPVVNAAKQFHPSVTTPTAEQLKASQQRRMEAQQRLKAKEQNEANLLNANMNRNQQPQQQQQQQQQRVPAPQPQQSANGSVPASKLLSNARSLSNPITTTPKAAPKPGLRPAQPPSRTASLNRQPVSNLQQQQQQQQYQQARQSPPMVQAGQLPTLNVGGSGARLSLAAGGGGGSVSDLSPEALGLDLNGGGFMSAGRMKRTADVYDSNSYDFNSHQPNYHLPREGEGSPVRGGGRREPLAELEMQVGGELKRSRLE